MQTRSSDEKTVRLSVCPSVKGVDCDKTEKKDLSRFLYYTKDHLAQFSEKKTDWCGRPLVPEIMG